MESGEKLKEKVFLQFYVLLMYCLGRWLGQPFLLTEVSSDDHPLSPFAFRGRHLVLAYLGVAKVALGQYQSAQVAAEAAVAAAA